MRASARLGQAISRRLRALDRQLGLDRTGRSDWVWAIPVAVFAATAGGLLVIGQITAAEMTVVLPNAVVIALVMAGLAVSCMAPEADDASPPDEPPDSHDTGPVLGLPGGPWLVVAWPTTSPAEPILDGRPLSPRPEHAVPVTRAPHVGVERN